jgi:hypothetical protein
MMCQGLFFTATLGDIFYYFCFTGRRKRSKGKLNNSFKFAEPGGTGPGLDLALPDPNHSFHWASITKTFKGFLLVSCVRSSSAKREMERYKKSEFAL